MAGSGDTFKRTFNGDVAQCGCRWTRELGFGDVLHECPIHAAAGAVLLAKFERTLREEGKCLDCTCASPGAPYCPTCIARRESRIVY